MTKAKAVADSKQMLDFYFLFFSMGSSVYAKSPTDLELGSPGGEWHKSRKHLCHKLTYVREVLNQLSG